MKLEELRKEIVNNFIKNHLRIQPSIYGTSPELSWKFSIGGRIDINGTVSLINFKGSKLPFKFGTITENFYVDLYTQAQKAITNFENFPSKANGYDYTPEKWKNRLEWL